MDEWLNRRGCYENIWWVIDPYYIDELIFMMGLNELDTVLAVGCGTGIMLKHLRIRYPRLSLYGIDSSPSMLHMAGLHNFNLRVADATNLPFKEKSFDVVFARMLLHHLLGPMIEKSLKEMKRVAKKRIVIGESVPIRDDLIEDFKYIIANKEDRRYFTGKDIEELFKTIELKNIRKKDIFLKSQSIMNWLNNSDTTEPKKEEILKKHYLVSDEYKKAANFRFTNNDIFSDMRHIIITGEIK